MTAMSDLLWFLCGSFLALAACAALFRAPALRRLERLADGPAEEGVPLRQRLAGLLEPLARRAGSGEEARRRLVQAGYRDEGALTLYSGGRLVLPVLLAGLGILLAAGLALQPFPRLILVAVCVIVGYVGPSYTIDKLRKRRQLQIRLALPDALDLMIVCLEAGLSLAAAFGRVAREFARSSPPLCDELRLVTLEMQAGKAGADALRSLADRVGIDDVNALAAMLIQSERFGTSVADALRIQADGMRKDRIQKAEERAQKAAVRLLLPAAGLIFPATMIILLGPAVIAFLAAFNR
jgi:tight adherence protein C